MMMASMSNSSQEAEFVSFYVQSRLLRQCQVAGYAVRSPAAAPLNNTIATLNDYAAAGSKGM
jgi:hypothetical protein